MGQPRAAIQRSTRGSLLRMAGRLAVLLPGVFALLAVFSTTAQAFHGCAVSFDGCSEQHCEPLVVAGTNRVR